ncbi:MAG: quinol oxidase [Nitrospirae bacterium]|nr:MAG: quinol oxidase [Nitrospirota bacterium]
MKILILFLALAAVGYAAEVKEKKEFRAVIDKDGVQRVEVIGGEYFFEPGHIIVKVNVPVELTVRKKPGIVPHDIAIESPDAGINFKQDISKEPKVIKFTPKKAGKYPIYCSKKLLFFKSHRERGMEGVLEVIE